MNEHCPGCPQDHCHDHNKNASRQQAASPSLYFHTMQFSLCSASLLSAPFLINIGLRMAVLFLRLLYVHQCFRNQQRISKLCQYFFL